MKKLLGKVTGSYEKFEFHFLVHQLRPWPVKDSTLSIGWQRGSQRKGALKAVKARPTSKPYAGYEFEETIVLEATLKRVGKENQVDFEKKFLLLAILEVAPNGTATDSLGTVVINLADFSNIATGPRKLAFKVAPPVHIQKALQKMQKDAPQIVMTISCTFKGKAGPNSVSGTSAGSHMTSDLNSFFRHFRQDSKSTRPSAHHSAGLTKEQLDDLSGLDQDIDAPPVEEPPPERSEPALERPPPADLPAAGRSTAAAGAGAGLVARSGEIGSHAFDDDGFIIDSDDESVAYLAEQAARARAQKPGAPLPPKPSSPLGRPPIPAKASSSSPMHAAKAALPAFSAASRATAAAAAAAPAPAAARAPAPAATPAPRAPPAIPPAVTAARDAAMGPGNNSSRRLESPSSQSARSKVSGWLEQGNQADNATGSAPLRFSPNAIERLSDGGADADGDTLRSTTSNINKLANSLSVATAEMLAVEEGLRSAWDDDAPRPMHRDLRAVLSSKMSMARREDPKLHIKGNPNPLYTDSQGSRRRTSDDSIVQPSRPMFRDMSRGAHGSRPAVLPTPQEDEVAEPSAAAPAAATSGGLPAASSIRAASGHQSAVLDLSEPSASLVDERQAPGEAAEAPADPGLGRWKRQSLHTRGVGSKGSGFDLGGDLEAQEVAVLELQVSLEREQAAAQALRQELLTVSALESAIYLSCVKSTKGSERSRTHQVHAPARRLMRAITSMSVENGTAFAQQVVRALSTVALDGWTEDVCQAVAWWSNILHMRMYLGQLSEARNGKGSFWACNVMLQPLAEVERRIFDNVQQLLWSRVMMPMLDRSGAKRAAAGGDPQEQAMQRWVAALDVANDRLVAALLHVEGYAPLFVSQMQEHLIRKIDLLFFHNIMQPGPSSPSSPGRRGSSALSHASDRVPLSRGGTQLPTGLLPFANPEMLKFSTGMQLKMAIMHLSHWAHDHDIKEETTAGVPKLYPYIRSVADALMMRKELLSDTATRNSTCGALSLPALVCLLDRFVPDEFSEEPMDANVLMSLREAARYERETTPAAPVYESPTIEQITRLSEREAAQRAKQSRHARRHNTSVTAYEMQTGDDSDADLEQMGRLFTTASSDALRFNLVRDLWNHAVDRRRE